MLQSTRLSSTDTLGTWYSILLYFGNTTTENTEVFYKIKGTLVADLTVQTGEGQGMDGYIKDAIVKIIDYTQGPTLYSVTETTTDIYGNYKFNNLPISNLPNIYEVQLLSGGIDITNNKTVNTTFSIITTTIESPTGVVNITPITTLVAELTKKNVVDYINTNGSITELEITNILADSKTKISTLFDIAENNINNNFITTEIHLWRKKRYKLILQLKC